MEASCEREVSFLTHLMALQSVSCWEVWKAHSPISEGLRDSHLPILRPPGLRVRALRNLPSEQKGRCCATQKTPSRGPSGVVIYYSGLPFIHSADVY